MPRIKLNSLLDDAKQALEPADTPEQPTPAEQQPVQEQPATVESDAPAEVPATVSEAVTKDAPPAKSSTPRPSAETTARRTAPRRKTEEPQPSRVHYATLVRKEARLRDDQIESLTLRARRLSRNKAVTDQRITDNTLIRIAVDMLLAKENDLAGTSEAELRRSVGL